MYTIMSCRGTTDMYVPTYDDLLHSWDVVMNDLLLRPAKAAIEKCIRLDQSFVWPTYSDSACSQHAQACECLLSGFLSVPISLSSCCPGLCPQPRGVGRRPKSKERLEFGKNDSRRDWGPVKLLSLSLSLPHARPPLSLSLSPTHIPHPLSGHHSAAAPGQLVPLLCSLARALTGRSQFITIHYARGTCFPSFVFLRYPRWSNKMRNNAQRISQQTNMFEHLSISTGDLRFNLPSSPFTV